MIHPLLLAFAHAKRAALGCEPAPTGVGNPAMAAHRAEAAWVAAGCPVEAEAAPADDPATVYSLLAAVREAYGAPTIHVRPSMRDGVVVWTVWNGAPLTDRHGNLDIEGPTEGEALARALTEAPR